MENEQKIGTKELKKLLEDQEQAIKTAWENIEVLDTEKKFLKHLEKEFKESDC